MLQVLDPVARVCRYSFLVTPLEVPSMLYKMLLARCNH